LKNPLSGPTLARNQDADEVGSGAGGLPKPAFEALPFVAAIPQELQGGAGKADAGSLPPLSRMTPRPFSGLKNFGDI